MAERLVDGMVAEWEPGKYRDEFTDQMLALIKRKARDGEVESVEAPEAASAGGDVVDFMALLKKSLDAKGKAVPGKAADSAASKGSRRAGALKIAAKKASAPKKAARRKSA